MEIILVRHTEISNPNKLCYGHSDIPLSSEFLKQAQALKFKIHALLNNVHEYSVYSSDSERCIKLSEIISPILAISDNRLKELNFGSWEGIPWAQINEKKLFAWMDNYVFEKAGNAESYFELMIRIKHFIEEEIIFQPVNKLAIPNHVDRLSIQEPIDKLIEARPVDKLIITHGGPLRAFLSFFLNLSFYESFNLKIPFSAVYRISLQAGIKPIVYPYQ